MSQSHAVSKAQSARQSLATQGTVRDAKWIERLLTVVHSHRQAGTATPPARGPDVGILSELAAGHRGD